MTDAAAIRVCETEAAAPPLERVPEGWIAVSQAATLLHVTETTVYRRIQAGALRGAQCRMQSGAEQLFIDPFSSGELSALYAVGNLAAEAADGDDARSVAGLSDRKRRTLARRLQWLRAWGDFRDQADGCAVLSLYKVWAQAHYAQFGLPRPPDWATVNRWRNKASAGVAALADGRRGPSPAEPSAEAWAFFASLYLTENRRTARDCWNQTRAVSGTQRWDWCSYERCLRKIEADLPHAARVLGREGETAHNDHCLPSVERDYDGIRPNDWWVCDHRELDLFCMNPATGRPERPFVTEWMDCKSRRIVGHSMHFCPDTDVLLATLRDAILEHGCPLHVLMDNGKDFKSNTFAGGCRRVRLTVDISRAVAALSHLPTRVHFAQKYHGQSKPIERFFGTVSSQWDRQWSLYRGNSTDNRPEGAQKALAEAAADNKVPTLEETDAALIDWERNIYGQREHRGHGMRGRSPNQVWEQERGEVVRIDKRELILLMMRSTEAKAVHANGVSMWGRWFMAPELWGYQGKGRCVRVRFDPKDIATLYVYDLKDALICEARRSDLMAWGAAHEDVKRHQKVRAQHKRFAASYRQTSDLLTGDAVQNIALQRRAVELANKARPAPTPPGGGEPVHLRYFRTAFAEAAEAVAARATGTDGATPRRTVGQEADAFFRGAASAARPLAAGDARAAVAATTTVDAGERPLSQSLRDAGAVIDSLDV
jgi:hypothetical protein